MNRADLLPRRNATAPRVFGRLGRVVRALSVLALLAQIAGILAGPLDHWRPGSGLGPHVEEVGGSVGHYVHNEATCVACAIGQSMASPERAVADLSSLRPRPLFVRDIQQRLPDRARHNAAAPRAPPVAIRIG